MRRLSLLSSLSFLLLFAVGCGGGGGNVIGGADSNFGPFQTRAQSGKPLVVTSSNGGPTVTGVTGAAFTKITFAPAPNPVDSRIAYIRNGPIPTLDITLN